MASINFEGRLTADPEIKYGQDGKPRASFTVAENFRQQNRQTQEWEDSGATFHNVTLFGRHAENPALVKGAIVTIAGTQKSRAYTNQQGENRQWTETTANSFGVVPVQSRQSTPPQQANSNGQWGGGNDGWPAATQPGQGYVPQAQQAGHGNPPF